MTLIRQATLALACLLFPTVLFASDDAFQAIEKGDISQLQHLLDKKLEPDAQRSGKTLLIYAIQNKKPEAVEVLLRAGAKVDFQPKPDSVAPLVLAASSGQTNVARMLVQHGAALNIQNRFGETPLLLAIYFWHFDTATFLLQGGADANLASKSGMTPILFASERTDANLVRMLLDKGKADVNAQTGGDVFPLFNAASYGRAEIVRILLSHGASVSERSKEGKTALDAAVENGYEITASILREAEVAGVASILPLPDHPWANIDGVDIWLSEPVRPHRSSGETAIDVSDELSRPPVANSPDGPHPASEEEVYLALKLKLHEAAAAAGAHAVVISDATTTQQTIYDKKGGGFGNALLGNILIGALEGATGCLNCGPVIIPGQPYYAFNKLQRQIKVNLRFVQLESESIESPAPGGSKPDNGPSPAAARWNDLRLSNDTQALESYVHDFPGGPYTSLAEVRLAAVKVALEKAKLPPVLFVYNIEQSFGGSQILVDGKPVVKLGSFRYAKIRLQPGSRRLQIGSLKSPTTELTVGMGDLVYLPVRGGESPNVGILPPTTPAYAQALLANGRLKPAKDKDILDPTAIEP